MLGMLWTFTYTLPCGDLTTGVGIVGALMPVVPTPVILMPVVLMPVVLMSVVLIPVVLIPVVLISALLMPVVGRFASPPCFKAPVAEGRCPISRPCLPGLPVPLPE